VTNEMKDQKAAVAAPAVDARMLAELVKRAQADGVSLTGEGGLLAQVTKVVLESALEGEMDAHLGYAKHEPAGKEVGNSRNGKRPKTVLTEVGPVRVEVPRDRDAWFTPADRAQAPTPAGRHRWDGVVAVGQGPDDG
jgi:putative transposase